jgi:hypothetical protein
LRRIRDKSRRPPQLPAFIPLTTERSMPARIFKMATGRAP